MNFCFASFVFTFLGYYTAAQSTNSSRSGSESGQCWLPRAAPHARYCPVQCQKCFEGGGACHIPAGSPVSLAVVRAACAPGHRFQDDQESVLVACDKGKWIGEFPQCLAQCPPLESESIFPRCVYNGREVDCGKPMMPRSTASVRCRPSYSEYSSLAEAGVYKRTLSCRLDGKWSHSLPECKPVCGVSKGSTVIEATVVGGEDTPLGVFPWHAGLYHREKGKWEYKCGGTLITNQIVLTAAHCVIIKEKDLQVAFAKYYKEWDKDDFYTVKRNVSDIRIPREFDYGVNTLTWDIAVLLLSQPVQINSYVMTICREMAFTFASVQNVTGYVVGWGGTGASKKGSEVLQHNDMSILQHDVCSTRIPRLLGVDKFCGWKNGESVVMKGDSGGGVTIAHNNQHFLLGIVSLKLDTLSVFTNCSWLSHVYFLETEISNFDQDVSKCPKDTFQCGVFGACLKKSVRCDGVRDCPDGTDEQGCSSTGNNDVEKQLKERPSKYPGGCRLPPQPDNGEYFSTGCAPGDTRQACRNVPGTSVTPKWHIKYSCNKGYIVNSPQSLRYSTCVDGKWKNPITCIKLCKPVKSQTRNVVCTKDGYEVFCEKNARPGMTATAACKGLSFDPINDGPIVLSCQDSGKWTQMLPLADCTTECGISTQEVDGSSRSGVPSKLKEFPWSVAVYRKDPVTNQWKQHCSGTLITTELVITAPSCVTYENGNTMQPKDIKVGLGKYYRGMEYNESYSVITNVELVGRTLSKGERGKSPSGVGMIAIGVLLDVKPYIMPACVSWASPIPLGRGYVGHLSTWDTRSDELNSTKLMYTNIEVCDGSDYQVQDGSFCAINEGRKMDLRRSNAEGAGLTLVKDGRHFVIGVLRFSTADNSRSVFTDVAGQRFLPWLSEQRALLSNKDDGLHTPPPLPALPPSITG